MRRNSLHLCFASYLLFFLLFSTYILAINDPLLDQIRSISSKAQSLGRASGDVTRKLLEDPPAFLKNNPEIMKKLIHISEKIQIPETPAAAAIPSGFSSSFSYQKMFYSFPTVAETTTKLGFQLFRWYMLYRTVENVYNFFTLYEEVQTLIEKNEIFTKTELDYFLNNELGQFVSYVDDALEKQQIFLKRLEKQSFFSAFFLTPFHFGPDLCLSSDEFHKLKKEINERSNILTEKIQKMKDEIIIRKESLEKKRGWLDVESKNNYKDIFISGVALTTGLILPASIIPVKTVQLFAPFVISSLTNLGINYLFLNPQKAKIDVQLRKLVTMGKSLEIHGKQFENMMDSFETTLKIVDSMKASPWLMFKWNYYSFMSSCKKTVFLGIDYLFIENWNVSLILTMNAFTIWWFFWKKKEKFEIKSLSRSLMWMFLQYFAVNLVIAFNLSLNDEIQNEASLARIRFQNIENQIHQECNWNNLSLWQQLIMTSKAIIRLDLRSLSSNAQGILVSDARCQRLREKLSFNSTLPSAFMDFSINPPFLPKPFALPHDAKNGVNLRDFQFLKPSKKWTIYFKVLLQGVVLVAQETFQEVVQFFQYIVDETSLDAKITFVGCVLMFLCVRRVLR